MELVGGRVIEFSIDFVEVVEGGFVFVFVVDAAGKVRGRDQRDDLRHDRIDPAGRNDIPGERSSTGTVRIAGGRVVDGVGGSAKVTGQLGGGGEREQTGVRLPKIIAFVAPEIEQLVSDDVAADEAAVIVVHQVRGLGYAAGIREEVVGLEIAVGVISIGGSVSLIGTALQHDVNGSTAGQALLGIRCVGGAVDVLNRFDGRLECSLVLLPEIGSADTLNAHLSAAGSGAVKRELQTFGRIIGTAL